MRMGPLMLRGCSAAEINKFNADGKKIKGQKSNKAEERRTRPGRCRLNGRKNGKYFSVPVSYTPRNCLNVCKRPGK